MNRNSVYNFQINTEKMGMKKSFNTKESKKERGENIDGRGKYKIIISLR